MSAPAGAPALAPGTPVRVKALFPPGHVRAPWYVRGRQGAIDQAAGRFADPEARAYGRAGAALQLYRVRFRQNELWPTYDGPPEDTLVVDIYETWLDAVGEVT